MGTEGMTYSLQSRDLIADSIETALAAQWYDANISISGLRQNMRIYGGTIVAGCHDDEKLDIISAFQSYGEYLAGNIDDGRR